MSFAKPIVAILLCLVMTAPGFAQTPEITDHSRHPVTSWFAWNYQPHPVPKVSFEDSPRIEKLMRAGNIYLSLRDAIALALENNLDIEYARLTPKLAESNSMRASAGQLLRNVSSSVSSGPSSATLGVTSGSGSFGSATGGTSSSSSNSGVLSGLNVQLAGTSIPNLDPTFFVQAQYNHTTTPQTTTVYTGTNFLVTQYKYATYGIQKQFLTGTTVDVVANNYLGYSQNAPTNSFNNTTQGYAQVYISQNLLQGFRPSINNRSIRVAKNQQRISDLTFKSQVISSVANVVGLYWDLVSDLEGLRVKQQTLELDTKLYNDNKRRAELGSIAPIDIIQAEAEMKAAQQDVTTAETQVLQQEMILKSALTRNGLDDQSIVGARVIPTDHFQMPAQEAIRPVQDLVSEAITTRPDVEQSKIALEDARITTLGIKDALMPTLSAFVNLQNNGLTGEVNAVTSTFTNSDGSVVKRRRTASDVDSYFLGGYGTFLGQIFGRNFPTYSAGFSLSVPIRNRSARADLITDQLNYRQQQIQDRQLHNSIKLNVINARTALSQARAAYDTSVEARKLQEQILAGTRRKYELGTATMYDVALTQRDTTTRELAEVTALNAYIHAKVNLQNVLTTVLKDYDVDIESAKTGTVGREPDLIPAVPPASPGASAGGALTLGSKP